MTMNKKWLPPRQKTNKQKKIAYPLLIRSSHTPSIIILSVDTTDGQGAKFLITPSITTQSYSKFALDKANSKFAPDKATHFSS